MKNFIRDGDFRGSATTTFDPVAAGAPSSFWTSRGTKTITSVSRGTYAGVIQSEHAWLATGKPALPETALQKVCVISITSPAAQIAGAYGAAIATTIVNGRRIFSGARAKVSAWVYSTSRHISFSLTSHFGDSSASSDFIHGPVTIVIEPNVWQRVSHEFTIPVLGPRDDLRVNDSLIFECGVDNVAGNFASGPLFMVETSTAAVPLTAVTGFACERVTDHDLYEPQSVADVSAGLSATAAAASATTAGASATAAAASATAAAASATTIAAELAVGITNNATISGTTLHFTNGLLTAIS